MTRLDSPSKLFGYCEQVDREYDDDLPMLLVVGDMPHSSRCPPSVAKDTSPEDWWSDGLAYGMFGRYRGDPVYVVEPAYWQVVNGDILEMNFALEAHDGGMIAEYHTVTFGGDALQKCVVFNSHDGLDRSKFDQRKFIFFDL